MSVALRESDMALASLQAAFQDYVLGRSDDFVSSVRNSPRADRTTLLDVYREGYVLRLVEVLGVDFPGLVAMTGPDEFERIARAYIADHPSYRPSVRWFGEKLTSFLASTAPWRAAPQLAEMAHFEWTLGEAWDAPDAVPLYSATLTSLPPGAWETLSFVPLPSLRVLDLAYEVPQAWQERAAVQPGQLAAGAAKGSVCWAIWRPDLGTKYRPLEPVDAALLEATIAGRAFPDLCDVVAAAAGEEGCVEAAAGTLRAWIEAGMFTSFRY